MDGCKIAAAVTNMGTEADLQEVGPEERGVTGSSFWPRVREHKIIQWGVAYMGAALALAQAVQLIGQAFDWPGAINRILIVGLIVGFPVALTLAWYHGHRGLRRVSAGELGIISVLGLIGAVFFTVSVRPATENAGVAAVREDAEENAPTSATATAAQPLASPSSPLPNSIAVLPFENLSPDPNNAFFAAGIHDELLNQLGKLKSLNVVARTSVMQYAGAARPITEIARELSVETVMEGSVSYAEGRIAVRAQLIDAKTGVHLWSNSYNREFADIFGIQADVAMNIANALEAEFSGEEQARIEAIPTASSEAYGLYLQAIAVLPQGPAGARVVKTLLDEAMAIDPNFAAAHAFLARRLSVRLTNSSSGVAVNSEQRAELEATVRRHALKALDLDEGQGLAHSALANLAHFSWRWTEAEAAFARAIELSPHEGAIAGPFGYLLSFLGRHEEAIALGRRTLKLDPANPLAAGLGNALARAGDYAAAAAVWDQNAKRYPGPTAHQWLAYLEIARGNNQEALEHLAHVNRLMASDVRIYYLPSMAYAFGRIGAQADAQRLFEEVQAAAAAGEPVGAGTWAMAYLAVGDIEQTLIWLEVGAAMAAKHEPDPGFYHLMNLKMNVTNDPVLKQPEFVDVLDRIRGD